MQTRHSYQYSQVQRASSLLVAYATIVVMGAGWAMYRAGGVDQHEVLKVISRAGTMCVLAKGLLSFNKLAWGASILLCSLYLVMGLTGVGIFYFAGLNLRDYDPMLLAQMLLVIYVLGHAVAILYNKEIRSLFQ